MKNKEGFRALILLLGIFFGISLLFLVIFTTPNRADKKLPIVGYVINGSIDDIGWNEMNYSGIKAACEKYNCKFLVKENIQENTGACKKAVNELLDNGASIIILSSNYYADEIKDIIKKNKKVVFFSNNADFQETNLSTYFVRMYQLRYITGIIAGAFTKTNEIGYIAAFSTPEVNRGISAFTLGVQRMNKNARVIVKWTHDWDNEALETAAVKEFAENTKIDVISYHQNRPFVVEEAAKYGIYSIAYHVDESENPYCLASIVCDWSKVYENLLINALYKQNNHEDYYWLGMEDDVLKMPEVSDLVDNTVKIKIESIKNQLFYGFNIFSGKIYDNEGNLRCNEDEALSDITLLENFDWLVKGAEIYVE